MARLLLSIICCICFVSLKAQPVARAQFVNNTADNALNPGIDVYINGNLAVNDLDYRTATPFIDIPSTIVFQLGIAPNTSTSVADAFYSTNMILTQADTIIFVANGLISTTVYSPFVTFSLDTLMGAREHAHTPGNVDLLLAHGATDAPTVDIRAGVETLADNLGYSGFKRYMELPFGSYKFRLTNSTGSKTIATYDLPLTTLTLPNTAGILITSGFINPQANSNGPAFSTMFVSAAGGPFVPLPSSDPEAYARLQLIHNSADKNLDTVDIYLDNDKIRDNFPFRTATEFFDVDVSGVMTVGLAPKNSTSSADIFESQLVKFDSAKRYVVLFDGIESTTGYSPLVPLAIRAFTAALEEGSNPSNTDILLTHGTTDITMVDLREGTNVLVDNLAYGNFASYISMPANKNYVLTVTNNDGSVEIEKYKGELMTAGLQGQALTLLMSGFQNPAANSNGALWGLYYATPLGGPLVPLAISTSVKDIATKSSIHFWPNPASDKLHFTSKEPIATASIYNMTGKLVKTSFKPEGQIDLSQLADGIYFIRFESGNSTTTHQFIKQ